MAQMAQRPLDREPIYPACAAEIATARSGKGRNINPTGRNAVQTLSKEHLLCIAPLASPPCILCLHS